MAVKHLSLARQPSLISALSATGLDSGQVNPISRYISQLRETRVKNSRCLNLRHLSTVALFAYATSDENDFAKHFIGDVNLTMLF